ncbi:MAG: hypothetical protein EBX17_04930 [Betaproteobacteria bacterium]|nr:hypothetical protein [Betaproteobacteria bacterium]
MNIETLESLHRLLLQSMPVIASAISLGWLFVRLSLRWLTKAWLRWPSALLIGAIAWIPFQGLPLGAYLSPLTASLSLLSLLLMLASVQLGQQRLFPASVWVLLGLLSLAVGLDLFAVFPWRILQWGYLADASRTGQILTALILSLLIFLIALKRPLLAGLCLLPAVFWRLEWSPSPNLWDTYLDLPLAIASLIGLINHFKSTKGDQHG